MLRFDSVGGASGDMMLGALIGLGVDTEALTESLRTLNIEPFEIRVKPVTHQGWQGHKATVIVADKPHPHRHLKDIRRLIDKSRIPDCAKAFSTSVFERLADAEAKAHDTTPDRIQFHEVGAMDSIIDIVGSCVGVALLDIRAVRVGPLPVGCGTITCEHGVLPVPTPAVIELLHDHPVVQTDEPFELVTPTGAALLITFARLFPAPLNGPAGLIRKTANSFGFRTLKGRPNLLRATLLHAIPADALSTTTDPCLVLECNVDDTVPEWLGSLTGKLLAAGALDVFTTAVQMKKQRPGNLLTVLCRPADRDTMLDLIFRETTTFGVREYAADRTVLARRHLQVETPYGDVRVKIGAWKGRDITRAPEFEDCARCATAHNVSMRVVYDAALRALP